MFFFCLFVFFVFLFFLLYLTITFEKFVLFVIRNLSTIFFSFFVVNSHLDKTAFTYYAIKLLWIYFVLEDDIIYLG